MADSRAAVTTYRAVLHELRRATRRVAADPGCTMRSASLRAWAPKPPAVVRRVRLMYGLDPAALPPSANHRIQDDLYLRDVEQAVLAAAHHPPRGASPEHLGKALREQWRGAGDSWDDSFAALRALGHYRSVMDELAANGAFEPRRRAARSSRVDTAAPAPPPPYFCVGDIVEHRFFGLGVVVGWDPKCLADGGWMAGARIHQYLRDGPDQPFYHTIGADGAERYCSEENLRLEAPPPPPPLPPPGSSAPDQSWAPFVPWSGSGSGSGGASRATEPAAVHHPALDRYFNGVVEAPGEDVAASGARWRFYQPNGWLQSLFPDDDHARQRRTDRLLDLAAPQRTRQERVVQQQP